MIDNKKIEEAAISKCGFISSEFYSGAKWMQRTFLKNLWHPASELPKHRYNYLLLHFKSEEEECFNADVVDTEAWNCYIKDSLIEYIFIRELKVEE